MVTRDVTVYNFKGLLEICYYSEQPKAQRVNEILAGAGYQHKINGKWEALPPGKEYAVATDGRLKWSSRILSEFERLKD